MAFLLSLLPWTGLAAIAGLLLAFRWGVRQRDEATFWRVRAGEAKASAAQAQAMVDALRADIASWKRKADEQAELVAGAQLAASVAVKRWEDLREQLGHTRPPEDPAGAIDWLAAAAGQLTAEAKHQPAPPTGRDS